MNKVILMGRLTRDPEVRYTAGENALAIARYTLAVDRRFRRATEKRQPILSVVLSSAGAQSLPRSIFIRESALWYAAGSRPEVIPTEKDRRYILRK